MQILHRELVYLWYYSDVQFRQIFRYWVIGMATKNTNLGTLKIILTAKRFVF